MQYALLFFSSAGALEQLVLCFYRSYTPNKPNIIVI